MISDSDYFKQTDQHVPFWSTIFSFVRPYRRQIVISTLCAMYVGVMYALQPITIKWIIDEGVLRKDSSGAYLSLEDRFLWAAGFVGFYVFLSVSRIGFGVFGMKHLIIGIEQFLCDLRSRFFRHVQDLCLRFHDQVSSGELFNYIMGSPLTSLRNFLHQGSLIIPIQLVSWCVAVTALSIFNWVMMLITLATVAVIVVINRRSKVVIREMSSDFMKTESAVSKYVADVLRGSRAIKIYSIEEKISGHFEVQVGQIRTLGASLAYRTTAENIKVEMAQYIGMAVIYLSGAYFCLYREMAVGTFFAFVTSVHLLISPIITLMQLNLVRANAEAGLERIVRILQQVKSTPELAVELQVDFADQAVAADRKNIPFLEFKSVGFAYDNRGKIFEDMSCTIRRNQSVALVGPSGSGKSTFVSLLLRLYDPQGGAILLNGRDIREYSLHDLRSAFGVVPQEPFIFQGTILDNIKVTRPEATEEEVRQAMAVACVEEFVNEMPSKLKTRVGEGGSNLSGGQRQRIAIARAVLANPLYYIFDEATSALDNQSERHIQQAMDTLMAGRGSFVIAHRLSTIRHIDRILVFDRGRIMQDGTYDELADREGLFRDLLRLAADVK